MWTLKKTIISVVLVLAILATIGLVIFNQTNKNSKGNDASSLSAENGKFVNSAKNYSFSYPAGWKAKVDPGRGFDVLISNSLPGESLGVIYSFTGTTTLDQQLDSEKRLLQSSFNASLGTVQKTKVSGSDMYKLPFTFTEDGISRKGIVVLVGKNSMVYGLMFYAGNGVFESNQSTIVNSLMVE